MRPALALAAVLALGISCAPAVAPAAEEALRGHGGPVRALSVAGDGAVAISGSFDSRAILARPARLQRRCKPSALS